MNIMVYDSKQKPLVCYLLDHRIQERNKFFFVNLVITFDTEEML